MMSSTSTPDLATSVNANGAGASAGMSHSYSSHMHSAHMGGSSPDLVSRRNLANSARNLNGGGLYSQEELSNNYTLGGEPAQDQEEPIYQNQRELMQQIIMQQVKSSTMQMQFSRNSTGTIWGHTCAIIQISK